MPQGAQGAQGVSASRMIESITDYKPEAIPPLRSWLHENPHFPPTTEEQLIMFAHSCYYDVEKTKNCIDNYYTIRSNSPEFFANLDLDSPALKAALSVQEFACLPKKTPEGYQVIVNRLTQFEPGKLVFPEAVKLLAMTMEAAMHLDGPQTGYYFVFDMTGARMGHLTRISISHLKKVLLFVQEANPVRLKGIHVVNTVPLLDKIMMLVKPFMRKDLLKLMHFHPPSQLPSLYEFIPQDCLPSDYGGALGSIAEYHEANTKRLASLKQLWKHQEAMIINERVRPNKKCKLKDVVSDIQRLELD